MKVKKKKKVRMKKKAKREDLEYNLLKPGNKIKRKFAGDESRGVGRAG